MDIYRVFLITLVLISLYGLSESATGCKDGEYYETAIHMCRSCDIPCKLSKGVCKTMGCMPYRSAALKRKFIATTTTTSDQSTETTVAPSVSPVTCVNTDSRIYARLTPMEMILAAFIGIIVTASVAINAVLICMLRSKKQGKGCYTRKPCGGAEVASPLTRRGMQEIKGSHGVPYRIVSETSGTSFKSAVSVPSMEAIQITSNDD